jgi:hypothetical protein
VTRSRCAVALFASLAMLGSGCLGDAGSSSTAGKLDPDHSIVVTGAIGGIHPGQARKAVEARLGHGTTTKTVHRHPKTGPGYTLTTVSYRPSRLTVMYTAPEGRPAIVFGIFTASPRYTTAHGLGVGSAFDAARHEPGIRCSPQPGYQACQGGLGFEKPVTSFTVKDGRVVRVFVVAVAD